MIDVLPVRTPTLPPATHTNCYRVGRTIIDPASPYAEEQERLLAWAGPVDRILITHHHGDHVGGVAALARATGAPVWAHRDARVDFPVDRRLEDGDRVDTGAGTLVCHHTPGHADGHLVFQVEGTEHVICGDLVAGIGTIVLIPPEGDLGVYLASLARVRAMVGTLHPAHGPALLDGPGIIDQYTAHRHHRTAQFFEALGRGPMDALGIATRVYAGLPGVNLALASLQVSTHLRWMEGQGVVREVAAGIYERREP